MNKWKYVYAKISLNVDQSIIGDHRMDENWKKKKEKEEQLIQTSDGSPTSFQGSGRGLLNHVFAFFGVKSLFLIAHWSIAVT